jgi:hypothetical protein
VVVCVVEAVSHRGLSFVGGWCGNSLPAETKRVHPRASYGRLSAVVCGRQYAVRFPPAARRWRVAKYMNYVSGNISVIVTD